MRDVDCTGVTYSTPPSNAVINALERNPSTIDIQDQPRASVVVDTVVQRKFKAKTDPEVAKQMNDDIMHCNWPRVKYTPHLPETKGENLCTSLLPYLESQRTHRTGYLPYDPCRLLRQGLLQS